MLMYSRISITKRHRKCIEIYVLGVLMQIITKVY